MNATATAVLHTTQGFDWYAFFSNPIALALISSGSIIVILTLIFKFVFKLGETNTNFKNGLSDIGSLKTGVEAIERCIIEIQSTLKAKDTTLNFVHSIATTYGVAHSPLVLKKEFKPFITESALDKQIITKKDDLLGWLKSQKPKTGLDAQSSIDGFVSSDEVSKYLDLTAYKQNLYKKGKTSQDAIGILAVYLYEVLIPELHIPDGDENKKSRG